MALRRMILGVCAAVAALAAGPAAAEVEMSAYMGWQTAPHSRVEGDHPLTGSFDALIGWEGKPFEAPPFYGLRGTWWKNDAWGFGVELTHTKAYAPEDERRALGFSRMEFTDGHNILTVNAIRRWKDQWGGFTPYLGAGVGVAVPHVDIQPAGGPHTYGYQLTGPAVRVLAGVSRDLTERVSVFGEYQFIWSDNSVDLDGGGSLETEIKTNSLSLGLSYRF